MKDGIRFLLLPLAMQGKDGPHSRAVHFYLYCFSLSLFCIMVLFNNMSSKFRKWNVLPLFLSSLGCALLLKFIDMDSSRMVPAGPTGHGVLPHLSGFSSPLPFRTDAQMCPV